MSKKSADDRRKAVVEAIQKNALATGHTDSMIKRIVLRNVATFGSEGAVLDNLQRVNYIYGGNGVGKTTLSRVLANISGSRYKDCEVEWTGMPLKVLVYNRDFRERNLMENIPGVFTLGAESVKAEKRMETLKQQLAEENKNLTSKRKRIDAREKQMKQDTARLRDTLWNEVLAPQRDYFWEILSNENHNANGKPVVTSKIQFARQMTALVETGAYRKALGREGLQARYRNLYRGETLKVMKPLSKPDHELESLTEITEREIWLKVLAGASDQGRAHGEGLTVVEEVCPMCGQRVRNEEAERQQEAYRNDIEEIRRLTQEYKEHGEKLMERLYGMMNCVQTAASGAAKHVEVMRVMAELLKERIDTNYHIMVNKLENPTMVAQFKDISGAAESLWKTIDDTNEEIAEHNKTAENIEPERKRLAEDLILYLAGRSASTVKYWQQATALKQVDLLALKSEEGEIMKKTEAMREEMKTLEKKLASTKPTVDRINNQLRRYGFTGFSIHPTKKGSTYQIQREDGSLVKDTLSEGEVTFITFLYYMQLVSGGETNSNIREKKVLVIDDPMSSLDKKVMGLVSDMVRGLVMKVNGYGQKVNEYGDFNQIFVLSHNSDFYKRVTRVNPRSGKLRGVCHWELTKRGNESRATNYGMANPVKIGYEELWRDLKEGVATGRRIQNTMRNIVETYFVEFGGYDKNRLVAEHFQEEEERRQMTDLMEWMDEGSHNGGEALYAETPREANREKMEMFRRLFVALGHEAHYRMMMREESL